MQVLRTLGSSGRTGSPGIFSYQRTPNGVDIYDKDGNLALQISNQDWTNILLAISNVGSFSLSDGLYGILDNCGYKNTSDKARIAKILEHEGSISLNGRGNDPINLVNCMNI